MSEIGDDFKFLRELGKEKRANNRENSAQLLSDAGIAFESKNGGAHLIVTGRYDFWPGTGLWMERDGRGVRSRKHRGVRSLIQKINGTKS